MKIKVLIIAIVAFFATAAVNASNTKKEVISKVKNEMTYPEFAINEKLEGDVWVAFRVDDEGKFQVFQANSAEPTLKALVVKEIERITPPEVGAAANELYGTLFVNLNGEGLSINKYLRVSIAWSSPSVFSFSPS